MWVSAGVASAFLFCFYYGIRGNLRKIKKIKPNPKPNRPPQNTWPIVRFLAHVKGRALVALQLPAGEKPKSATPGF